jgi:hypothetical protein
MTLVVSVLEIYKLTNISDEEIKQRIINQKGYEVIDQNQNIDISFQVDPNWFPDKKDEERFLDVTIYEGFNTKIILNKVSYYENLYIDLIFEYENLKNSQHLVTTSLIKGKDSLTDVIFVPEYFDKNGNKLNINDGDYANAISAGVWFKPEELEGIEGPITLKYSGLNLIKYKKK